MTLQREGALGNHPMPWLVVHLGLDTLRDLVAFWPIKLVVALAVYLVGSNRVVHIMYGALAGLMLVDLATGIWRAAKTKQLSSRIGVSSTMGKFGAYFTILLTARLLELLVVSGIGLSPDGAGQISVRVAIVYLALQEAVSIDENLRTVNGIGLGIILTNLRRLLGQSEPPAPPAPGGPR